MVSIWLDDFRPAPDNWIWAKNVNDCLTHLTHNIGNVDILSLDHDLGEELTGYDLVKFLVDYSFDFPRRIYLHTSNPVGRSNMYQLLSRAIEVDSLDIWLVNGPYLPAWEESMKKCKELGYF